MAKAASTGLVRKPIKITVMASVTGNLAIHEATGSDAWSVTHIPTGLKITSHETYDGAMDALFYFLKIDDWNFENLNDLPHERFSKIYEAVGKVKYEHHTN
jgi:hypothetical protein